MRNLHSVALTCSLFVGMTYCLPSAGAGAWSGKKVSVLGDSYTAYKGCPGCVLGAHYPNKSLVRQDQMWWAQVIDEMGGTFVTNRACGGAALATTYGSTYSMWYMAVDHALGDPDIILAMGGLNDFWVLHLARGWSISLFESDLRRLFNRLKDDYPNAEKVFVLNKIHSWEAKKWGLTPVYRNLIREYVHDYGFKVVDLDGSIGAAEGDFDTDTYPHPTLQGQTKIAQRVIACLQHAGTNDYDRVYDCLELDGQGYMLTDYVPNLATTKIEVKMREAAGDIPATNAIFYASGFTQGEASEGNTYSLIGYYDSFRYENRGSDGVNVGPRIGVSVSEVEKIGSAFAEATADRGGGQWNDSCLSESGDVVNFTTSNSVLRVYDYEINGKGTACGSEASGPLVIGAARCSSNGVYTGMSPKKIYGVKIWEGAKLVRDYVPVTDIEGRATLYDRITDDSLAVYGGTFKAVNYAGDYVNAAQCQSYTDLSVAYAAANSGESVEMRTSPADEVTITGRVDVALNTMGNSNVVIVSPSVAYRVTQKDGVYYLEEGGGYRPTFVCASVADLFTPVEGKLHIRLGNIIAGATYTVYTGKSPYGPWTAVASGVEKSEFEIDAPEEGTAMLFIKAEMTMGEGEGER